MKTKNKQEKEILGVPSTNFLIYLIALLIGLALIVPSIVIILECERKPWADLLLALGSGFLPSSIIACLIDRASNKREKNRIAELRKNIEWGLPHGVLFIMKCTIQDYYPFDQFDNETLNSAFEASIKTMQSKYSTDSPYTLKQPQEVKDFLKRIEYGLHLCIRDTNNILSVSIPLQIDAIFSSDEIHAIGFLNEVSNELLNLSPGPLSELAENIEILVTNTIQKIEEIGDKANCNISMVNRQIEDWPNVTEKSS